MIKRSIAWKILSAYVFLILIAILVLRFFVGSELEKYYSTRISATLLNNAALAGDILRDDIAGRRHGAVRAGVSELAKTLDLRVTIIDPEGEVLADSERDYESMDSHLGRQEVIDAISAGSGEASRFSNTLKLYMRYVAIPVRQGDKTLGVIRLAKPLTEIRDELRIIDRVFIIGGVIALLVTFMIGYVVSRNISDPLRKMEETTRSIAGGDLSKRLDIRTKDELGGLSGSFNSMADELQVKIDNLEKMDRVRTDFVANVSHELKTPLTSIRGFIETLEDGAIDDRETALRFLSIIRKHSERLGNIINDLLSLAEIEDIKEKVSLDEVDLKILTDEVIWGFGHAVSIKEQILTVDYQGKDFFIKADSDKIEQVLVNLVDNAIKYTGQKGRINCSLFEEQDSVMLVIEDSGIGIDKEHLDRIFERFYRVDKARSRESGGTGLGLSIVKHILALHDGHIDIDSTPGKGTKVTVILPK